MQMHFYILELFLMGGIELVGTDEIMNIRITSLLV